MKLRNAAGKMGFSTLEALISLAVTGLVLTLALSVGLSSREIGFRLGVRAAGAPDRMIAAEVFSGLVTGLSPAHLEGGPGKLTGPLVAVRATPCAPAGPTARVSLFVTSAGGRTRLGCARDGAPARLLFDLGAGPAALSYSRDGRNWSSEVTGRAGEQKLFVRLATLDGAIDWIEMAS